jgi:hypothetical protein
LEEGAGSRAGETSGIKRTTETTITESEAKVVAKKDIPAA